SNVGTSPTLEVHAPESGPSRETYLRFDLLPAAGIIASATLELVPITVSDPLYHALAFVPENSWTETGITWNNKPTSGPEFIRWPVPSANTPVLAPVTALAQQVAVADGTLSLRVYSTGTSPPTNGGYTAYGSEENGEIPTRPQLILTVGRAPPAIVLTSPANNSVFNVP